MLKDTKNILLEIPTNNYYKISIKRNIPIFDIQVNGTKVKATLSLANKEPVISKRLQTELNLTTRKLIETNKEKLKRTVEKSRIIVTPQNRQYHSTETVVEDYTDTDIYDIRLGTDFIKNKKLIINYKEQWIAIW